MSSYRKTVPVLYYVTLFFVVIALGISTVCLVYWANYNESVVFFFHALQYKSCTATHLLLRSTAAENIA